MADRFAEDLSKACAAVRKTISEGYRIVVIGGMAKTGTTLPLTLLDDHPNLIVFPEELRFFHNRIHELPGEQAHKALFSDSNIKALALKKAFFESDNYSAHSGTGFGTRDYSQLEYQAFESLLLGLFKKFPEPENRIIAIFIAFQHALGRALPENPFFVCKAPHNEKFSKNWTNMVGKAGRFVVMTRVPTEHFLSLSRIYENKGIKVPVDPYSYIVRVRKRRLCWQDFPSEQLHSIDYDSLINLQKETEGKLLKFIGVSWSDRCAHPTKMGIPWSGNSSRKIVSDRVFSNPHKALNELPPFQLSIIEFGLRNLYQEFGWEINTQNKWSVVFRTRFFGVMALKKLRGVALQRVAAFLRVAMPAPTRALIRRKLPLKLKLFIID